MVTDEVGKLRWAWGQQVRGKLYFIPSVRWHCWFDDRKGHLAFKKLGVGLLMMTICLELCTSYSSSWSLPLPSARERERERFWYHLTGVVWANAYETSVECAVVILYYRDNVADEWESCSSEEEEDDSDGSWINVSHSSDEEQVDVSTIFILVL